MRVFAIPECFDDISGGRLVGIRTTIISHVLMAHVLLEGHEQFGFAQHAHQEFQRHVSSQIIDNIVMTWNGPAKVMTGLPKPTSIRQLMSAKFIERSFDVTAAGRLSVGRFHVSLAL